MKNQNVEKLVKVVTIAGSAVLVLNSIMGLVKAGTTMNVKGAVMPLVSISVGLAAFKYAMASPITLNLKK
jgi:hypothetical protein